MESVSATSSRGMEEENGPAADAQPPHPTNISQLLKAYKHLNSLTCADEFSQITKDQRSADAKHMASGKHADSVLGMMKSLGVHREQRSTTASAA